MSEQNGENRIRYGIDPYLEWVKEERIPVVDDYGVDLFEVQTADWPRCGMKGAAVHLKGRGDFCNMFVFELAPAASSAPQRHLYEEVIYVLEGRGSTQIEIADGQKPRMTVQLDTGKGDKPQSVTFTVGDNSEAGEFDRRLRALEASHAPTP